MPTPLEKARDYLERLEADRRTALEVSEQKAEQAKLIKARQEGFQAAMEIFGITISVGNAGSSNVKAPSERRIRRHTPNNLARIVVFRSGNDRNSDCQSDRLQSQSDEDGSEPHGSDRPNNSEWRGSMDDRHRRNGSTKRARSYRWQWQVRAHGKCEQQKLGSITRSASRGNLPPPRKPASRIESQIRGRRIR
jgi:hypothetical protein